MLPLKRKFRFNLLPLNQLPLKRLMTLHEKSQHAALFIKRPRISPLVNQQGPDQSDATQTNQTIPGRQAFTLAPAWC